MSDDAKRASTESADSAPSPSSRRNVVTAAPVERDSLSDVGSAASSPSEASITPPPPPYSLAPAKARRRWREDFYDHVPLRRSFQEVAFTALPEERSPESDPTGRFPTQFLDGAAGVMYTSFLGLILDDLIALGTGKYKKC